MRYFVFIVTTLLAYSSVSARTVLPATEPTAQPTNLTFTAFGTNSLTLSWTSAAGNPEAYLILRRTGSSPTDVPVDGVSYVAGNTIGSSTVVFAGTSISFSDASLSPATTYYYAIFSYNITPAPVNYLTTNPLTGNRSTLALEPTDQPTAINFTNIASRSVTTGWTAAASAPSGYIVLKRTGSSPADIPSDGRAYTVGNLIGSSRVVQVGAVTSFTELTLLPSTQYFYDVFSYNGSSTGTNYFVASPLEGNFTTLSEAIQSAEYFFDTDPGVGSATVFSFTSATTLDQTLTIAASSLAQGMHLLGVRIRDNSGWWSVTSYTPVYVLQNDPVGAANINAVEYFFDLDPGVGSGTITTIGSPANTITLDISTAASSLTSGMHMLGVRTRDSFNAWSVTTFTPVYVGYDQTITKLEYFFDSDPGAGSGTSIDIDPDTDILDQNFVIDATALSAGSHTLYVRPAGMGNLWGIAEEVPFTICSTASPSITADVVCAGSATTFTDNSTGVVGGDVISWDFQSDAVVDATTSGNQSFTYSSPGTYTATLSIDRAGCISSTTTTVTVDGGATGSAGSDFAVCSGFAAPLSGSFGGTATFGIWSTSGDGNFSSASNPTATYFHGTADQTAGSVTLTFTTEDPPGACGAVSSSITLSVNARPTSNAGSDVTVCQGTAASLNGSFGASATSATWGTTGDGTFNNASSLTAQYTPGPNDISSGSVMLTLFTNDPPGPCLAEDDDMIVTIAPQATVNAGPDQSICGNALATLSGTRGGSATTSLWATSGDGIFGNAANVSTSYTPGSGDLAAGTVTLTLTTNDPAGPCNAVSDQLTLSLTRPINIVSQSANATLETPVSVTVTTGGTFNTGDVLTSTIMAAAKKGTAQLSGNTLTYTSSANTGGKDSVQVRVCNQCTQCDTEFIFFNIQNIPPTITPPAAVSGASGSKVTIPLPTLISDMNNNQDLASLAIVSQPISGAPASIDPSYNLVIDYTAVSFQGIDELDIRICDFSGACAVETFYVQVGDVFDIQVFNAVSPNGDGKHDFLEIQNIQLHPQNRVRIFNRWGDLVFDIESYDNNEKIFAGKSNRGAKADLPAGTYFYLIEIFDTNTSIDGFVVINR
jgi:gliding motility-associated-like protein